MKFSFANLAAISDISWWSISALDIYEYNMKIIFPEIAFRDNMLEIYLNLTWILDTVECHRTINEASSQRKFKVRKNFDVEKRLQQRYLRVELIHFLIMKWNENLWQIYKKKKLKISKNFVNSVNIRNYLQEVFRFQVYFGFRLKSNKKDKYFHKACLLCFPSPLFQKVRCKGLSLLMAV